MLSDSRLHLPLAGSQMCARHEYAHPPFFLRAVVHKVSVWEMLDVVCSFVIGGSIVADYGYKDIRTGQVTSAGQT